MLEAQPKLKVKLAAAAAESSLPLLLPLDLGFFFSRTGEQLPASVVALLQPVIVCLPSTPPGGVDGIAEQLLPLTRERHVTPSWSSWLRHNRRFFSSCSYSFSFFCSYQFAREFLKKFFSER